MGITVLGPSVNESVSDFSVNKDGDIRFGLSALKGVGEGPVEAILEERVENGQFETIFDMVRRLDLRSINKRVMESLAFGGGFDCFEGVERSQYFAPSEKYSSFIEHSLKYGNAFQNQQAQAKNTLFGDSKDAMIPEPAVPEGNSWPLIEKLTREKEVTGIYVSGHPLDDYRLEVKNFMTCSLGRVDQFKNSDTSIKVGGIISSVQHRISKNGNGWGLFELSDFNTTLEFRLFGEDYLSFKHMLIEGKAVYLKAKFQKSWRNDDRELKVQDIKLLDGIAETMTESITIKLPLEKISNNTIDALDVLCKMHQGKHRLRMEIIDRNQKLKVAMVSKERGVNANNDFIKELERLGVNYLLN
jgi:DNA polymerase-3 subunit alpha